MFGHKSQPSRIWSFKIHGRPTGNLSIALDQFRSAHQYRNRLIELELTRRFRVDELVLRLCARLPEVEAGLAEAETRLVTALAETGRLKSAAHLAGKDGAPIKEELAAARAEVKEARRARKLLYDERKALRADTFADPAFQAEQATIEAEHRNAQKEARAASGLYWGTYLAVEQSLGASLRLGPPPRFRRWEEDGVVAVQCQKGLPWQDALACLDSRIQVRILPTADRAARGPIAPAPNSNRSRKKSVATLRFRVGSEGDRKTPVFVEATFHLHRQPPMDARIKWVYLRRSMVGRRDAWSVQFVLSRDSWDREYPAENRIAGLDFGWRNVTGGIQVARLVDDAGHEESLIMPSDWVSAWDKVESLRSIRDRNFNEARDQLSGWAKQSEGSMPGWFAERLKFLRQWRSTDRLSRLVSAWRDQRFPGDETVFATMEAWRKQNRHLLDWERAQAVKSVRRRDDLYRKFAAFVGRTYRTVRIEDSNLKDLRSKPGPEADTDGQSTALRRRQSIASPGRLLQFIREAVAVIEKKDAVNTTRRCHACGTVNSWDQAKEVVHTCSGCGVTWHQDTNAAINLRDDGDETRRGAIPA